MKNNAWKRRAVMALCLLMLVMIMPLVAREADAAETSAYEAYQAVVKAIDDKKPKTQKQLTLYDSKTEKKKTGICSVCSITTLLNRRLAYDNISASFNAVEVVKKCGGSDAREGYNKKGKNYGIYAHGYRSIWASRKYSKGGANYQATTIGLTNVKKKIGKNYNFDSFTQYIALQLHEHPEGIVARFNYSGKSGGHVIVFTKYEIVNGKVQLYVYDPVNNNSKHLKFESSYMYKNGGKKNIHKKLDFICYLKGSKTISPLSFGNTCLFEKQDTALSICVPGTGASYSSSTPSVCTVDSKGGLKAIKAGQAELTVKRYGLSFKAKVSVLTSCKLKSVSGKAIRKAVVSWEKNSAVSGYQLQYSQKKDFSGNTTKKVTYKSSVNSATVGSLTLWKTYYFRIRSYVVREGRTIYAPWSPVISFKVKY